LVFRNKKNPDRPIRLAVFFSGGGSTLQNLVDRIGEGKLNARIEWTLASRSHASGIEKSRRAGIECHVLPRKDFDSSADYSAAINKILKSQPVDLIILAGFMSLYRYPPDYAGRVLNVHPALLPAFGGKGMYGHHVHEAVLASGAKETGATVHIVDEEYDRGPIVLQESIPVLEGDTPESLADRVQALERKLYPQAIQLFAEGRLQIEKGRVRIMERSSA
jgi:formyltetrahydrofolate-dependent phosphoribosylglycinamide formyltransferase